MSQTRRVCFWHLQEDPFPKRSRNGKQEESSSEPAFLYRIHQNHPESKQIKTLDTESMIEKLGEGQGVRVRGIIYSARSCIEQMHASLHARLQTCNAVYDSIRPLSLAALPSPAGLVRSALRISSGTTCCLSKQKEAMSQGCHIRQMCLSSIGINGIGGCRNSTRKQEDSQTNYIYAQFQSLQ